MVEERGYEVGNVGIGKHANLDGIDVYVFADGIQLLLEEIQRRDVDAAHALGILGNQRGDHAHSIPARGGDGLQIGLDAGSACGIGSSNRENTGVRSFSHGRPPLGCVLPLPGHRQP